jgi:large subunit ribosomal protein L25
MAMELSATVRTQLGRAVKALRKDGMVPAELYGHGIKNEHVAVSMKDLRKVLRHAGETSIIDLTVAGKKHPVFIHDVLRNPITDSIENVDFYRVRMDQKIKIKVPLVFTGEAPGVKEKGGVLVRSLAELEIEALPADIPHNIEVDLTKLADIGSSLHVSELTIPGEVRVMVKPEFVVATITARMTEEQEAALAAKGADVGDIKTEGEEKKAAAAAEAPAEGAATETAPAKK